MLGSVAVLCGFGLSAGDVLAGDFPLADKIIVEKGQRKLHLLQKDKVLKSFDIALGLVPTGDKHEEGDLKTPEGNYNLDARNTSSDYFLSIHVSYPNADDVRKAEARGVSAGGQIMIHGQPNTPTYSDAYYRLQDWTNGCIAVSNSDMIDIWLMTPNDVPIEIRP